MIQAGRVLQPLDEAANDVERLTDYETAADLAAAVRATFAAVERSLRRLLRADPGVPENVRLSALSSADLPLPRVIESLRQRDLISIHLAGAVHELEQASQRAAAAQPRAGDADVAVRTVDLLREEVRRAAERESAPAAAAAAEAGAAAAPASAPSAGQRRWASAFRNSRRFAWLAAGVAFLVLALFAYTLYRGLGNDMDEAVAAFASGREETAERLFHQVLRDQPDNVTARLYLARLYRRSGRLQEAGAMLREAAQREPRDADVRRELGHLMMSLGRAELAAEQYRIAVEADPESSSGWIGLVTALRAANDPQAEIVLARAPADARAALTRPQP